MSEKNYMEFYFGSIVILILMYLDKASEQKKSMADAEVEPAK